MSLSNKSRPWSSRWLLAILVVVLLASVGLAVGYLSSQPNDTKTLDVQITPLMGSRPGPDSDAEDVTVELQAAVPSSPIRVGIIVTTSGQGGERIPLRSGPDVDGIIMDHYDVGEELLVVESDADAGDYPIDVDGSQWVRVRAPDGLVGWVNADKLSQPE